MTHIGEWAGVRQSPFCAGNERAFLNESLEDDFQDDYYDVLVNGGCFRVYGSQVEDSWAVSLKRFLEIVNELLDRRWMPYTSSTIATGE